MSMYNDQIRDILNKTGGKTIRGLGRTFRNMESHDGEGKISV